MKKRIFFIILFTQITFSLAAESQIVEAAKNGDFQTVKSILAQDPSKLNETDEDNFTALHWALIFSRDEKGKIHHAQLSFIRQSYTIVKK